MFISPKSATNAAKLALVGRAGWSFTVTPKQRVNHDRTMDRGFVASLFTPSGSFSGEVING